MRLCFASEIHLYVVDDCRDRVRSLTGLEVSGYRIRLRTCSLTGRGVADCGRCGRRRRHPPAADGRAGAPAAHHRHRGRHQERGAHRSARQRGSEVSLDAAQFRSADVRRCVIRPGIDFRRRPNEPITIELESPH